MQAPCNVQESKASLRSVTPVAGRPGCPPTLPEQLYGHLLLLLLLMVLSTSEPAALRHTSAVQSPAASHPRSSGPEQQRKAREPRSGVLPCRRAQPRPLPLPRPLPRPRPLPAAASACQEGAVQRSHSRLGALVAAAGALGGGRATNSEGARQAGGGVSAPACGHDTTKTSSAAACRLGSGARNARVTLGPGRGRGGGVGAPRAGRHASSRGRGGTRAAQTHLLWVGGSAAAWAGQCSPAACLG